ncbi:hypothetical protein GGS26DRAFT_411025 [Hypomontagnella submonticulosa]|nr:hypothetical protein GGS26DRAFT_411025 [Hypomontagnella submonticulosa]
MPLTVELPKISVEDYTKCLISLPMGIRRVRCFLHFHNGPLPNTPSVTRWTNEPRKQLRCCARSSNDMNYVLRPRMRVLSFCRPLICPVGLVTPVNF